MFSKRHTVGGRYVDRGRVEAHKARMLAEVREQELIEKVAKAIYRACWDDLRAYEEDKQQFVEYAAAALAVFREHTAPTDDDRDVPGFAEREKRAARAWELFADGEREMSHDFRGGYHQGLLDALRRGAPAEPAVTVTDEMVERAARSIAKSDSQRIDVVPEWMEPYRPIARAALEAALSTERGK